MMDIELVASSSNDNNGVGTVNFSGIEGLSSHELNRPPRKLQPETYVNEKGETVDSTISLPVDLIKILFRDEFKCPICLDTLDKTWTVTACLHRFCAECLHRSLRSDLGPKSHHECPSCRAKMASRRASKPDSNFDTLISKFTSNGRLNSVASSADKVPLTTSSQTNVVSEVLKSDSKLDLEHYRRIHREKVEQFKGQSKECKKRPFNDSFTTNYPNVNSMTKRQRPVPQQASSLATDKVNMESTVNVSVFPCPKWKEASSPHLPINTISNPSLRENDLLLKKPYLRVPPQLRVADMKQFLKKKYQLSEEQFERLQITVNHVEAPQSEVVLVVLDDELTLLDVANQFWDGLGEFTLFFRLSGSR